MSDLSPRSTCPLPSFQEPLTFLWQPQFLRSFDMLADDRMGFDDQLKRSAVLFFLTATRHVFGTNDLTPA
jgi:hypothetical protein